MTRKDLVQSLAAILGSRDYARQDAQQLAAHACNCTLEDLIAHPETFVPRKQADLAFKLAKKREADVPMAYLLGYRDFFGRRFFVNKHVLVPRPETEHIIEEAVSLVKDQTLFIDLGTGSGAIACTLAAETKQLVIGTDVSRQALRVAKKNARAFGVDQLTEFKRGSLLQPIKPKYLQGFNSVVICANLPYLSPSLLEDSPAEVTEHEPSLALVSDENDGLNLYRELLEQFMVRQDDFPAQTTLLLEIDPRQEQIVEPVIREVLPNANVTIKPDLAGHLRVVIITA